MERLQNEIRKQLLHAGATFVGFADVSDITLPHDPGMKSAISLGIAYDKRVVRRLDVDVDTFERHVADTKERIRVPLKVCSELLQGSGFNVWTPPISKNLPGLRGDFSHKMAATKAGLGWVGKSSLFVSNDFGCGLRLATVLTDAPFFSGKPVSESRCRDCTECVKACPYGAIKGATWQPAIDRDELLDAFLCSAKREAYIPTLGYKHPCGLCIQACPVSK